MRSRRPPHAATGPIPPASALFDPTADPPSRTTSRPRRPRSSKAGWTQAADGWHLPGAKTPVVIELLSLDEASNTAAYTAAVGVARDWTALGLSVIHRALPPAQFVTGRLATGDFSAAVGDVTVGLDPTCTRCWPRARP